MAQLKRFGFGLQALIILAMNAEQCSSTEIADQIGCEPTALRKILSQLREADIIEVRQGRSGGYQLTKGPDQITLFQIYTTLQEEEPVWSRMLGTTGDHVFGKKVNHAFQLIMSDINIQVSQLLGSYTLANLIE